MSAWAVARERATGKPPEREISMLVLSRKLGEKIVIGDNIVVTVVKIDRNQIRIGIEAPQEVPVYREEISPVRVAGPKPATSEPALLR
jgi:carbon storage regulator